MKKKYYLSLLVFFLLGFSFGQSIFTNPITGINPNTANPYLTGQVVDANITASGIGRGIGIVSNNGNDRYNARGWNTAAFDNTAYFEFTITPNAGYEIDFVSFVYTSQRSNVSIANFAFRSSIDGFTTNIGAPDFDGITIDLSDIVFQDINTPITFRFYAWGAGNFNNTFSINDFTFNGSTGVNCPSTTTWNGAWVPDVPDNTYSVIIDANYDTAIHGGSFDACSLTVNADLNINGTDYVQVTNDITINNGDIIVASEANLVQISDASAMTLAGTGVGVVQKTTTPLQAYYSYTYWSSPFTNETIGEAASGMDLIPVNRIFEYDASNFEDVAPADGFDDNSDDWNIASGAMIPGRGYAAFAQVNGIPFPQAQTYNFDGEFNNGLITTLVTTSVGALDPNWNLLGNPYPSGISADAFILNNPDLDGTIYLWTHNSVPLGANPGPDNLNFSVDDYASYTPGTGGIAAVTGGIVPTGTIASGQGFFIEALNAGTATFNNAMRATTGNDNLFRATDRIWLNLENDYGAFSQILIGFVEGATDGVDRLYDGKRLDGGSLISFSSLIDDVSYAIQGKEPLTEEELVPLAIKNLVEGENEYWISIENVEGLLETSGIFLIDHVTDITHDLNSGEYRFTSEQGVHKDRFELFLKNNLSADILVEEKLIIIKNPDESLSFTTTNNTTIQNIQVFDVLGRQLFDENFSEEERPNGIKLDQLRQTIFIARATLSNGKVLTKKGLK